MTILNFRFEESGEDIHLIYWVTVDRRTSTPSVYDFGEILLPAMVRMQVKEIRSEWIVKSLWLVDIRTRAVPEVKQFAIKLTRSINADKIRSTEYDQ